MAPHGQDSTQRPQRVQSGRLIAYGFPGSPAIAPCGHAFAHAPQPVHFPASIEYAISALQTPAGHLFSLMCARYSSLK